MTAVFPFRGAYLATWAVGKLGKDLSISRLVVTAYDPVDLFSNEPSFSLKKTAPSLVSAIILYCGFV